MSMQAAKIPLVLFFVLPVSTSAATYYVAPNGSDANPGTIAQPFATIQHVHDIANPGDTIYVRGGIYNISSQITITRDGVSGNPIKLFAYPGEIPVIDAAPMTQTGMWPVRLINAWWWHIKALEIKNGIEGGITIGGDSSNNIIENLNVHHNGRLSQGGTGVSLYGTAANNLLLNNDSHYNKDIDYGDADGFVMGSAGTGNVLRGNRAWRNSDDGFDMWNGAPALLEGNWAWENGFDDILQPLGNGQGFKLGGQHAGRTSGGHTIKNNLAWKNRANGFDENAAQIPLTLYNNTAWSNGHNNFSFWGSLANTFRNNLSVGPGGVTIEPGTDAYNSWTLSDNVTTADFVSVDYTIARGLRNTDGSSPTSNFLRLASGSGLIDKGIDIGLPYSGTAPDLGAYEYEGEAASPSTSPADSPDDLANNVAPPPSCTETALNASAAVSDGGFAYLVGRSFGTSADSSSNPKVSQLRLFENGLELGPAHSLHTDIRNRGQGRFSHWSGNGAGEALRFAASNNTNPRTNGRRYTYCVPGTAADLTSPTASITAPANGATVSGTAVSVSASATDNVGVAGVQFKLDGANLGAEDTTAPYSVNWNSTTAGNGTHTLTAVARDAAGNTTTSPGVFVTVNNVAPPPSCTETALNASAAVSDSGFAYLVGGTFGTPADNSSNPKVSQLRLFENGLELGPAHSLHTDIRNRGQGRFSHWSSTDGRGEALRFAASDNSNPRTNDKRYTYCVPGTAADLTSPTASITAPANGATVSGTAASVSASATDNVGVAGVQFKLNGANLGAEDTTFPYSISWNSTLATNGAHTLTAVASDVIGNTTTSAGIIVTVNNTAPSSCTQSPLNVSAATSEGAFGLMIVQSFGTPADTVAKPTRSVLKIFENGVELGPAHSLQADIANLGQGRFSHWSLKNGSGESLRFAAPDNTDPRTNGRKYAYCVAGR